MELLYGPETCMARHHSIKLFSSQVIYKLSSKDDLQDVTGNTPLHVACENAVKESEKYVKLLIEHQPMTYRLQNSAGQTPLHLVSNSDGVAATMIVETLINQTRACVALFDRNNNMPLHVACLSSKTYAYQIVNLLIAADHNINNTNANKETPLHMACLSKGPNKEDIITTLVEYGADLTACNRDGFTATDIAVCRGEIEIATALTNAIVTSACFFGLPRGRDILRIWNKCQMLEKECWTILHKVCEVSGEYSQVLINDLVHCHSNVNAKDVKGRTPLHTTCTAPGPYSKGIVKELLELGADINCRDSDGHNALHFACTATTEEAVGVIEILAENGISVDERDEDGDTPLHKACQMSEDLYTIIQALIRCGASLDYYNNNGATAFDIILQSMDHSRACELLFSTKLWQICNGNTELNEHGIQSLMIKGASLDYIHEKGNTVLHKICSQEGEYALKNAKLLLSLGADPSAKNAEDQCPYETALLHDNIDIAEYIAEKQMMLDDDTGEREEQKSGSASGYTGFLGKVVEEMEKNYDSYAPVVMTTVDHISKDPTVIRQVKNIAENFTSNWKK